MQPDTEVVEYLARLYVERCDIDTLWAVNDNETQRYLASTRYGMDWRWSDLDATNKSAILTAIICKGEN